MFSETPLTEEEIRTFSDILKGTSKERRARRNFFLDEISNPKEFKKRQRFQIYLHSGESSKLFDIEEDEAAQRIMKIFEPHLWKIDSKSFLNQNLLHFFITSRFKSSLVYLLRHPNQHVRDMVFEKDLAAKTPLMVSLKSLISIKFV